jgi:uncharacterized protein YcgI (DUF1989 family)
VSDFEPPRGGVIERCGGVAVRIAAGESLRIVNIEGGQVVDAWAVNPHDPGEYMSMEHTRVALCKLVPQVGDDLYSCRRRPLLTLVEDTSPGVHDTLLAACDAERYRLLGVTGFHANCSENYVNALGAHGLSTTIVPAPLNLFMNIPWQPDGSLSFESAPAAAGDYVTVMAAIDAVVVLSACPQDLTNINGGAPKPIGYERSSS